MKDATDIAAEKSAKPRVDVVPPALMLAAGRGFGLGVAKHGLPEGNDGFGTWRTPGHPQSDPLAAYGSLMRHLLAWRNGEVIDPESGDHRVAHLDAACAQLAKLVDLVERGKAAADPWALPEGWEWYRGDGTIEGARRPCWYADQELGGRVYADGDTYTGREPRAVVDLVLRRNAAEPDGGAR